MLPLLLHSKNRDRERSAKRLAYYERGFAEVCLRLVDNYKGIFIERENQNYLGIDQNDNVVP